MRHLIGRLRPLLVQAPLFFGLWVLCSGQSERADLLAGAVAALIACAASRIVARHGLGRMVPRPRWLAEVWHLPWMIVTGITRILKVLALRLFANRKADSKVACIPFDGAGSRDEVATRRALIVAFTTTAPNFIVIDFSDEGSASEMRYHQIDPTAVPPVAQHLGARG